MSLHIQQLHNTHLPRVDLKLAAAECVAIIGESGIGKSLLLRAVADLDPHEGKVSLDEVDAQSLPPAQWRRRVGLLMAESQWWHDRVGEHFPPRWADSEQAQSQLQALALTPAILQKPVAQCSTGERQRLALLRLLAGQPQVLLLDEPSASLDTDNSRRLEKLIDDYRRQHNAMVIWVSHDSQQAQRVADRVMQMTTDGLKPWEPA